MKVSDMLGRAITTADPFRDGIDWQRMPAPNPHHEYKTLGIVQTNQGQYLLRFHPDDLHLVIETTNYESWVGRICSEFDAMLVGLLIQAAGDGVVVGDLNQPVHRLMAAANIQLA